jgi:MoxR-like ATPase
MKLSVGYPSVEVEQEILNCRGKREKDEVELTRMATTDAILEIRQEVEKIHIDQTLEAYIVTIMNKTRSNRQVTVGASPRGSLSLLMLSKAWAALQGRNYVIPDDIKHFVIPALHHRLILDSDLWLTPGAAAEIIIKIVEAIPVPVIEGMEAPLEK